MKYELNGKSDVGRRRRRWGSGTDRLGPNLWREEEEEEEEEEDDDEEEEEEEEAVSYTHLSF